jgi:hypothetical protein
VFNKAGKPSSVWGFDQYLARRELTRTVKPWKRRQRNADVPDPLEAIDGTPVGPLTRDEIYED